MLPVRSFFGRDFESLFDRMLDSPSTPQTGSIVWRPRLDAYRDEDGFVIEVDLPGVDPEEVDVTVEEGVLTIHGERTVTRSEDGFVVERFSGAFTRRLTIPDGIAAEDIAATYTDGVLRLVLPTPEEPEPKVTKVAINRS